MALLIIREEMGPNLLGTDLDPVLTSIAFVRKCCCVVLRFVSCVLRVWNHCVYRIGGNLYSNVQQMALWIIREEMRAISWERIEVQFQRVKRLSQMSLCCSWLCIVCISVRNHCLLIVLRKLRKSERPLRPQRFLCPPRPGIEIETSRTVTSH